MQNREKQGRNEDNLRTARQLRRESGSANGEDGKIYRSAERGNGDRSYLRGREVHYEDGARNADKRGYAP